MHADAAAAALQFGVVWHSHRAAPVDFGSTQAAGARRGHVVCAYVELFFYSVALGLQLLKLARENAVDITDKKECGVL